MALFVIQRPDLHDPWREWILHCDICCQQFKFRFWSPARGWHRRKFIRDWCPERDLPHHHHARAHMSEFGKEAPIFPVSAIEIMSCVYCGFTGVARNAKTPGFKRSPIKWQVYTPRRPSRRNYRSYRDMIIG